MTDRRRLWVIEVREENSDGTLRPWEPTYSAHTSREHARHNQALYWREQCPYTRVVRYGPIEKEKKQ